MQLIDLKAQYIHINDRINTRINRVLAHGQYIMGPEVTELEERLANYVGVKHVISCANGTYALQLSLMALGIGPGDAVIVPTFTFFASAEAISFVGATPVFVDIDPYSFNISCELLEDTIRKVESLSDLTLKAIMGVDLFGQPADYKTISSIAQKYNLRVIEDAAQGFGGSLNGKIVGSFGDIATTSFFPAKPLGCYGDGGAIFTNNDDYAELLSSLRVHGKGGNKYDNVRIGMNSRLDTIQAAILLEKLDVFPDELRRRNQIAALYDSLLGHYKKIQTPYLNALAKSSWAQYTVLTLSESRNYYINKLKQQGISSAIYYETCMHQQTAFKQLKNQVHDNFPVAERVSQRCFSLPMHPYLADEEIQRVVEVLIQ